MVTDVKFCLNFWSHLPLSRPRFKMKHNMKFKANLLSTDDGRMSFPYLVQLAHATLRSVRENGPLKREIGTYSPQIWWKVPSGIHIGLINANKKSATRFPMSLMWSSYVAPTPPNGDQKRKTAVFGVKSHFAWRKSVTKFLFVSWATCIVIGAKFSSSVFRGSAWTSLLKRGTLVKSENLTNDLQWSAIIRNLQMVRYRM